MAFTVPPLPFAMDALEPYMSSKTLSYHYGKHNKAYNVAGDQRRVCSGDRCAGVACIDDIKCAVTFVQTFLQHLVNWDFAAKNYK